MGYGSIKEPFSLRNLFHLICTLLTFFLIGQDLFTLAVVRPTIASKEGKDLEIADIPEVLICLEPGFDFNVLEKY